MAVRSPFGKTMMESRCRPLICGIMLDRNFMRSCATTPVLFAWIGSAIPYTQLSTMVTVGTNVSRLEDTCRASEPRNGFCCRSIKRRVMSVRRFGEAVTPVVSSFVVLSPLHTSTSYVMHDTISIFLYSALTPPSGTRTIFSRLVTCANRLATLSLDRYRNGKRCTISYRPR